MLYSGSVGTRMPKKPLIALLLCGILTASTDGLSAQKLEKFEKPYKKSSHSKNKSDSSTAEKMVSRMGPGDWQAAAQVAWFLIRLPAIPFVILKDTPRQGYAPYPYFEDEKGRLGYGKGTTTPVQRVNLSYQQVPGDITAVGARYRMMWENHLGIDFSWSRYKEEGVSATLNFYDLAVTGNLYQTSELINSFGLGFKALDGTTARFGPELRGGFEWFPMKPLAVDGTAALSLLNNRGLWDLRIGGGILVRQLHFRVGYRALVGRGDDLTGPEASLSLFF